MEAGTTAPFDALSYAEIASNRNPDINVGYISSAKIEKDSVEKALVWSKLHCV